MLELIVAVGNYVPNKGYPIGKDGKLPWNNKNDLKWFKKETEGNIVIMGRKTYESIGHPLNNRFNIVISKSLPSTKEESYYESLVLTEKLKDDGMIILPSLSEALSFINSYDYLKKLRVFLIGGESLYKAAIENKMVDRILIDYIAVNADDADAFLPDFKRYGEWKPIEGPIEIEHYKAYAMVFEKKETSIRNKVDDAYLTLLNDIIENGTHKNTRSGPVRSVFGRTLRFNLKDGMPLLTTKRVYYKGVLVELLWFLKGDTNIKYLVDNNVHIWDDDAYRYYCTLCKIYEDKPISKEEFLTKVSGSSDQLISYEILHEDGSIYNFGDLGPVYGKQWRNWDGVDQIRELIYKLKNKPDDRRLMVSAWNVADIKYMALPPCHYASQFYTRELLLEERIDIAEKMGKQVNENIELLDEWNIPKRELSCMWQQRSVDYCAGLPFNIASYATLTYILCEICNMIPGELIFNGGDVHVYENHVINALTQLNRKGSEVLPTIKFNRHITNINDIKYEDITIENYNPDPSIKYQLNVG